MCADKPEAALLVRGEMRYLEGLLERFPVYDPTWPDETQQKWVETFQGLMNRRAEPPRSDAEQKFLVAAEHFYAGEISADQMFQAWLATQGKPDA